MVVYFFSFLVSLLLFYAISKNKKTRLINAEVIKISKKKFVISRFNLAVFCASIPPMFISAVRYYVGTDYLRTYYTGFYRVLDGSVIDGFEIGFYFLIKGIQIFTDNAFWLFIITSIIFVGVVYKSMEDISIDVPLSIILFLVTRYYFIGMNGVRQFLGMAFLMYSIRYIYECKFVKYSFFIVLACLLHYTCILFAPAYFISKFSLTRKRVIALIIGDIAFLNIGIPILMKILSGTKYGLLVTKYDLAGIKFTIFTITLNFILFMIGYIGYKRNKSDLKYCACLNIQFFAFLISLTLQAIPLMERVYWIYSFPIIVTLPYLLNSIQSTEVRKAVKCGIVLIYLVYMIYDICILRDHDVLPYRWIFGESATHYSGWDWYGGRIR